MTDEMRRDDLGAETATTSAAPIAGLVADVAIGVIWAALVVAIVLFSGVASQFAYVDF